MNNKKTRDYVNQEISNQYFYSHNPDENIEPATVTKLARASIVFDTEEDRIEYNKTSIKIELLEMQKPKKIRPSEELIFLKLRKQ